MAVVMSEPGCGPAVSDPEVADPGVAAPGVAAPGVAAPGVLDPVHEGEWLQERWEALERDQAAWMLRLAAFVRAEGWRAWGYGSGVDWLTDRLRVSTTTAFEQLRVATQLERRPMLFGAFAAGRVGYSAVRAITRVKAPPQEIDAAFIEAAEHGTLRDVEHAVRHYRGLIEQEVEPHLRLRTRGLRLVPTGDGFCKVSGYLTATEGEELQRHLDLITSREEAAASAAELPAWPEPEFPHGNAGDQHGRDDEVGRVSPDSPHGNTEAAPADSEDWLNSYAVASQHRAERRADALMGLTRMAGDGLEPRDRADRYLVHLIVMPDGTATLTDGTPVDRREAQSIICDSPHVVHVQDRDGNPLYQGRKSRDWNTAQRRAALVRDGGHCRFPGCWRRNVDLHHLQWWERGGPTDIDNGYLTCRYHHTMVHEHGYVVTGHPHRTLTFTRPDGRTVGATNPIVRRFAPSGAPPAAPAPPR